ncbi:MAG: hypothetical protein ACK587_06310 [Cyanobacteriota bacterium]
MARELRGVNRRKRELRALELREREPEVGRLGRRLERPPHRNPIPPGTALAETMDLLRRRPRLRQGKRGNPRRTVPGLAERRREPRAGAAAAR